NCLPPDVNRPATLPAPDPGAGESADGKLPARAMKTLAVIPARLESTRFPRKPLAMLRGLPLVEHVWRAVGEAGVDRLVVATDSDEIAACVTRFGGEVFRTRAEHATGSDRVAEVASKVGQSFDAVINVQGDQPLLEPGAVKEALRALAL